MMQKSQVQEMFPTIGHGGWWRAFMTYGFLLLFSVAYLPMLVLGILGYSTKGLDLYLLLALILSWIAAYFLANRSVRNFYFDVTDEGIVVRSVDSFGFLTTVPFSKILDVIVRSAGGNRYIVETLPIKPWDARRAQCQLYYFDKNTAFALKNYIIEKKLACPPKP